MKLKDFELVVSTEYLIFVNTQGRRVDRFNNDDEEKMKKYQNAEVGSIDILDADTLLVIVEW